MAQLLDFIAHILHRREVFRSKCLSLHLPRLALSVSHLLVFSHLFILPDGLVIVFSQCDILLTVQHVLLYVL